MKKKVLMISCSGLGHGGAQAVMMSIVRGLSDKYTFDIVCNRVDDYYNEEFESYGGKVFYILNKDNGITKKIDFYIRYFRVLKEAKKIIRENGPYDVIHCHNYFESAIYLKAAVKCGIGIRIVHSHNSEPTIKRRNPLYRLYKLCYKRTINKLATKRIGCSESACQFLFGNVKTDVIYNAIDLKRFDYSLYNKSGYNENDMINFIHVGRFTEQKNQLFLIDIFSNIIRHFKNCQLMLIGFGADENKIRDKINMLGLKKNISIYPHDSNIPELMSKADFLLFPSKYEGLGIVVIEAQAMMLHAFVSNAVPKEADLGNCSFIDITLNSEEWAKYICEYIEKEGVKKRKVDMTKYDIENVILIYDKIYNGK